MTSFFAHGIRLSFVLGHSGMDTPAFSVSLSSSSTKFWHHALYDIGANWTGEDRGKRMSLLPRLTLRRHDGYRWAARHLVEYWWQQIKVEVDTKLSSMDNMREAILCGR